MNIHLREVICTSKDGDRFWRIPECYIRGIRIKNLRVPDEATPGLGHGRGRGSRKDGLGGRQPKGIGRGLDAGAAKGGGGRGRGGSGGNPSVELQLCSSS
ncbi:hypothetical protein Ddye_022881 [Dipteronia dyeriana]|uniref:U6 snRNA-associated Sm-like protein LSm4 n=1 Tax=Dipteronia dyeriana TaxID=168575 RepID=A0AAD9WSQ4_9ROSI|nr:hypothetical protein Ddye_022881 [Dipteronia dyeriana]